MSTQLNRFAAPSLVTLILFLLCLDFGYGIHKGEADTLFQPIYRVRQSLAIAISQLRIPPAGGHLAYQSVIDSLNRDGFAVFRSDKGPLYDPVRSDRFLSDGQQLNAALAHAMAVPINHTLPPDIIRGNEPGYADYVYLSFRLFGVEVSSLYFLYFLILAISVGIFVVEFHSSPFQLSLLGFYLACLFLVHEYAVSIGVQLNAIQNSRLFPALALLPAAHIALVTLADRPLRLARVLGLVIQASFVAFLAIARTSVLWEVAAVMALAIGYGLVTVVAGWTQRNRSGALSRRTVPAVILLVAVGTGMMYISWTCDARYERQTETHVLWHNVLSGLLSESQLLRAQYAKRSVADRFSDQLAFDAVMQDLNTRNDDAHAIAFRVKGRIYIDPERSWKDYEQVAGSLLWRIAAAHPFEVMAAEVRKVRDQWLDFVRVAGGLLLVPLLLAAPVSILGGLSGAFLASPRSFISGLIGGGVWLASSQVPALVLPSLLNVGALVSFLVAAVTLASFLLVWVLRLLARRKPLPEAYTGGG